jgi:hypothetical protein
MLKIFLLLPLKMGEFCVVIFDLFKKKIKDMSAK